MGNCPLYDEGNCTHHRDLLAGTLMMSRTPRLHTAWIVFGVTFLVMLTGAGIRAAPGALMMPLEMEFGWSPAALGGVVGLAILLYGLVGPFAAALYERFGLRRCICAALLLLAAALALSTQVHQLWQMRLVWGIAIGLGSGMVAMVLGATVAERWFASHRGLVLGVLTASSATGQLVFLPAIAALNDHAGWRIAVVLLAAVALAMVPVVALLLRDTPAAIGLRRVGEADDAAPPSAAKVNPALRAVRALRDGLGRRDFWLLAGTFFICGASTNGLIGTHLIPACADHGIPEQRSAELLAAMGIFDLVGTTASGWLTDRFDARKLLFAYYGLRGLSLIWLPWAFGADVLGLPLFAAFYGLDWIATVPPTVRLAERAFGKSNAAVMFGWVGASHQIGAACAAWLAGVWRTDMGSYGGAFAIAGVICVGAGFLALAIGRRAPVAVAAG